tara:strand:- start:124 stop:1365 length:1242 start_codon:yes stop_codon:yes gene_type:complete
MTDKILSPDGKQEWNGTEWVPLSGHSTAPGTESIVNYAELCVDALNRGDMTAAKRYYDKAKELDFKTATRIFESDYALEIGTGYANIVETKLVQIINTEFSANMNHFGMGVVNWDIDGDFEMDSHLQTMEIAFNNALAFLGNPSLLISGGSYSVRMAFLRHYDADGDGIADDLQRELDYKDYDRMENDLSIGKKVVNELEITELPVENIVKQQLRLGLCLECASMVILARINPVCNKVAKSGEAVTLKFLRQKTGRAAPSADEGRSIHLAASVLAISAGYPLQQWKEEDFNIIGDTFSTFQYILQNSFIHTRTSKASTNTASTNTASTNTDCFIATAAYGTPFDSKIDVLRNWRDDSLRSSTLGRIFIRNYYFYSPPIASVIARSSTLRGIVRFFLSPIILLLKPKHSRPRKS